MLSTDRLHSDSAVADELALRERYLRIRELTRTLCETLTPEDCCLQSMPVASPIRWHLAHTTWFFETFVLAAQPGYRCYHPQFGHLFNSYYNSVGNAFPQAQRGLLSRPTVAEVWKYREHVDAAVATLLSDLDRLSDLDSESRTSLEGIVELGLQHEQQHQELMLTDIKHAFSLNPMAPVYRQADWTSRDPAYPALRWCGSDGGLFEVGHNGPGFAYDNECPKHRVFLEPFELADRLVTAGEYLRFMEDGGYQRPEFWLSAGWEEAQQSQWRAPLYWHQQDGQWMEFTLAGLQPLDLNRPVCHVSYFEADAMARWCGARLPTEIEWEVVAVAAHGGREAMQRNAEDGAAVLGAGFVDRLLRRGVAIHPQAAADVPRSPWSNAGRSANPGQTSELKPRQMFGDAWEWTSSAYSPYPGYQPPNGALGEYNGKFMCNQYVLRGGSCASSSDHLRVTYRNFFPAARRWQFSGIRLARST